jgi:glycosyltransferase involved in cell wall biosynthesis
MERPVKIAMIAPPWYRVPPRAYGGIEALVAGLVDELVALGHDVLLVCAGPSRTAAQTVCTTFADAPSTKLGDEAVALLHSELAERAIRDFAPDIVHDHTLPGLIAARHRRFPTVVTAHGPISGFYGELLGANAHAHVVAISRAQQRSSTDIAWHGVVRNGVPVASFPVRRDKDDHLLFLGRMDPDKGVVEAIEVAERTDRRLLIAARMQGQAEEAFFETRVRPRLGSRIEYIGEVGSSEKLALLSGAAALLFPLQWDEPYGLVVAEAQACGTPVLSLRRGAIPEIVREGETAILGDHHDDLVAAMDRLPELSPQACRRFALTWLDISRTARGYESVFESVLAAHRVGSTSSSTSVARPQRLLDLRRQHAATGTDD